MKYLQDLTQRITGGKMLSTRERAFFNALLGAFVGLLVNALPQLPYILAGGGARINITLSIVAMLVGAFALAFANLLLAQTDPVKAELFRAYSDQLEQAALNGLQATPGTVPVVHIIAPLSHPIVSLTIAPMSQQSAIADHSTVAMPTQGQSPANEMAAIAETPTAQMTAVPPVSHGDPTEAMPVTRLP